MSLALTWCFLHGLNLFVGTLRKFYPQLSTQKRESRLAVAGVLIELLIHDGINGGIDERKRPTRIYSSISSIGASHSPDRSMTLLLLHGTGGDENDLIPIARMIDTAGASILSPRGKVLENGMPRFFRRLSEGVFDLEDLKFRTHELADFLQNASKLYKFNPEQTMAVGYSNGANIAASMLLLRPEALAGAILFRAMVPFVPESVPNLSGKHIFMSAGLHDPIIPSPGTKRSF